MQNVGYCVTHIKIVVNKSLPRIKKFLNSWSFTKIHNAQYITLYMNTTQYNLFNLQM